MQRINDDFINKLAVAVQPNNLDSCLGYTQIVMYRQLAVEVASRILAQEQGEHDKNTDIADVRWNILNCRQSEAFFYYPDERSVDYVIKHPFADKCIDNPDETNYLVSGKLLGLISSMVALKNMELDLLIKIKQKQDDQGKISKVLGRRDIKDDKCLRLITKMNESLSDAVNDSFENLSTNLLIADGDKLAASSSKNAVMTLVSNLR